MHSAVPSRRRGFTLMEILVVVAIIAILVTMTVLIATTVRNKALVGQTNATLNNLDGNMARYIKNNPEPSGNPADWPFKLLADPDCAKNVTTLKGYIPGNPPQFLDAWGNPIYYLPSRNALNNTPPLAVPGFPQEQGRFYSMGPNGQVGGNDDLFSAGVAP